MYNLIPGKLQFSLNCELEALQCITYQREAFILKKKKYMKSQNFAIFSF